jgi:CheY-like chemotaxis protein
MPLDQLYIAMLEDDADDRYLTNEILTEIGFTIKVQFFSNSDDLLKALSSPEKPQLILVDFNSTPDNGIQVLKKIKSTENLREIPVVILSDSALPRYKRESYAAGANSFVTKPKTIIETKQKISSFFTYWMQVAEL